MGKNAACGGSTPRDVTDSRTRDPGHSSRETDDQAFYKITVATTIEYATNASSKTVYKQKIDHIG